LFRWQRSGELLLSVYAALPQVWPDCDWIARLARLAEYRLQHHSHGDLPRWRTALKALPAVEQRAELDRSAPQLGANAACAEALRTTLMALHPWRKGPISLGGVLIDSEWRSDWKWARIAQHVDLRGQRILDVGCGNGYYGLRMLGCGARLVVGIDPTLLYVMQWLACRHFSGNLPQFVLPLGAEDLPLGGVGFDAVFSMGVLYHRRDPLQHLQQLRGLLAPRGRLVLESLVLPAGRDEEVLVPRGRYARMRNVWAIPGTERLVGWLQQAGFPQVDLVYTGSTTTAEQRSTRWMQFESLEQALDPADRSRTVEGHPAPIRAVLIARR